MRNLFVVAAALLRVSFAVDIDDSETTLAFSGTAEELEFDYPDETPTQSFAGEIDDFDNPFAADGTVDEPTYDVREDDHGWSEYGSWDELSETGTMQPLGGDNRILSAPSCDSSCGSTVEIGINNTLPIAADFYLEHLHGKANESHFFKNVVPGGKIEWFSFPVEMLRKDYDQWRLAVRFPKPGWWLSSTWRSCTIAFRSWQKIDLLTVYDDKWEIYSENYETSTCKNYTFGVRRFSNFPPVPSGYNLNAYTFIRVDNRMGSTASVKIEMEPGKPPALGQNATVFLGVGEKVNPLPFIFEKNSTKTRYERWSFTVSTADGTVTSQNKGCRLLLPAAGRTLAFTVSPTSWKLGTNCSGTWDGKKTEEVDPLLLTGFRGDL